MVTTLGSLFLYCISKQPETPNFQSLYQSLPWSDSWGSFFHVHPQTIDFSCKHCLLALPSADYWLQLQSPPVGLPSANHWVQSQSLSVDFAISKPFEFSCSCRLLALLSEDHWIQSQSPSVGFAIWSLMTGFAISKPLSSFAVTVCWLAISKSLSSVAVTICWLCHLMIGFAICKSQSSVAVTICRLCHWLSRWVQ